MAYNTYNADYYHYIGRYYNTREFGDVFNTDVAYGLLNYLGNVKIGLEYQQFVVMITIIGLSIVYYYIVHYSTSPALSLTFIFIFTFHTHTIQLRAFIAESLIIIALLQLLKSKEKYFVKFIIIVGIASLFHSVCIFYLIFLIPKVIKSKIKIYFATFCMAGILPFAYYITLKFGFTDNSSANTYLGKMAFSKNVNSYIFVLLFVLVLIIISFLANIETIGNPTEAEQLKMLSHFHVICLVFCGMIILYNNNFYRFNRTLFTLDFIVLINYFDKKGFLNKKNTCFLSLIIVLCYLVSELLFKSWYNTAINNSLLNGLVT